LGADLPARADQRIMVGCGAAAAIAGAFGAPLAGAFYAFELVIGGYTPASLTPVGVAAVAGYFVTHGFAGAVARRRRRSGPAISAGATLPLPHCSDPRGVVWHRHHARRGAVRTLLSKTGLWPPLRPALGGLAVGLLALLTRR